ncbi:ABC transporter permease [Olivibacter ginsenosidimutans]|uniref:ABC transporter permease n=1 Tax=Olivibacter ginsenosidimutans TaxID=1176537 RepID=A0ABP9C175_9SPHI
MVKSYFKIAWRNLWRNKAFSLINIIGLSLGMASMLSLALLVNQYITRDEFHEHKDQLYYLKTFSSDGNSHQQTTFPLLYEIEATCPEVEAISHWQGWENLWLSVGKNEIQGNTIYVDPDFLRMFSFKLVEGEPTSALQEKQSLVISKRMKTQLFGDQPALGETVMLADSIPRVVTAVVDMPTNTSLHADVLLPVQFLRDYYTDGFKEIANWYNVFAQGYLMLRAGTNLDLLNKKIATIVQQHYASPNKHSVVKVVPFTQLKTETGETVHKIIIGAMAAAVFVLLIVVVNLVNLNMATTFNRTKEVAVRRVIGSSKQHITTQFCVENSLIMAISLALGFVVFRLILLTMVNGIAGERLGELDLSHGNTVVMLIVGIAIVVVLLAASLPNIWLNSQKLADAIKGKVNKKAENGGIRNTFITTQFVLGITFLCMAFILHMQIRYMKSAALGFNTEEVVVGSLDLGFNDIQKADSHFKVILQSLKADPYVKAVSTSQDIPTAYGNNSNGFVDVESEKEVHIQYVEVDAGFVDTYQIPIIAGRNFDDQLKATESDKVLINEAAVKAFGWSDPVGKRLRQKGSDQLVTVIGVMKDFHYKSLDRPIAPLIHWYAGESNLGLNTHISIRIDPHHQKQIVAKLETSFKQIPSKKSFRYQMIDERVENQYALLDGILKVTNYVALLILLIACMGLLGLSMLFAQQRIKEIGIRKVLGASVTGIVLMLSKDYIKLVMIAIFIASPIAWWIMNKWLDDFAYRITIQWWIFALAGLSAISVAMLTVGWQAARAAVVNPVKSLQEE